MKAVLMSIQPKWCEKIARGEKTVEVRKTRPKLETPFKCYIYCTKDELLTKSHYDGSIYISFNKKFKSILEKAGNITFSGKVIGEFMCDRIEEIPCYIEASEYNEYLVSDQFLQNCKLSYTELYDYFNGKDGYGLHISDLKIYDNPKELKKFRKPCPYGDLPCWSCPSCDKDENDNIIQCFNTVSRPPQSWCYVEEL